VRWVGVGDRGPWLLVICVLEYVQYILSAEAMCTKSRPDFSIDVVSGSRSTGRQPLEYM